LKPHDPYLYNGFPVSSQSFNETTHVNLLILINNPMVADKTDQFMAGYIFSLAEDLKGENDQLNSVKRQQSKIVHHDNYNS